MNSAEIAVRYLQFGQTQRYHTELLLKPQDVAQHTYGVMWLCWQLSAGNPSAALLMAALAHDAGERKTGDMPAPTKRTLGVSGIMDDMEYSHVYPTGLFTSEVWEPLSLAERQILKLADVLEGGFFCLREVMMGNRLLLDPQRNGAALNYLSYAEELLGKFEAPEPKMIGAALYIYLKEQFNEHSRTR